MLTSGIGIPREREHLREYKVSWEEVIKLCDRLALKLESGEYKKIIAVSRGGLIPACLLAHRLKINRIECFNVNKLDPDGGADLVRYQFISNHQGSLVVDEIVDTGYTFTTIRKILPYATYVALFTKERGAADIDFVGYEKALLDDTWVIFPWQVHEHGEC